MKAPIAPCRFGDRCELRTLADAIECLGGHSEKTRTEIARETAAFTGKSEGYLRSALSPNDDTHVLQLSIAPALFKASGNPALLLWHARSCGYGIHRLATSGNRQDVLRELMELITAFGPVGQAARMLPSLPGQHTPPAVAAEITIALQRLIQEASELIAAVNFDVEPRR